MYMFMHVKYTSVFYIKKVFFGIINSTFWHTHTKKVIFRVFSCRSCRHQGSQNWVPPEKQISASFNRHLPYNFYCAVPSLKASP